MATYPKHDAERSGIKVSWLYYKDEDAAKQASDAAMKEAERKLDLGYDFGFQSPGLRKNRIESGPYAGMWEVCIP